MTGFFHNHSKLQWSRKGGLPFVNHYTKLAGCKPTTALRLMLSQQTKIQEHVFLANILFYTQYNFVSLWLNSKTNTLGSQVLQGKKKNSRYMCYRLANICQSGRSWLWILPFPVYFLFVSFCFSKRFHTIKWLVYYSSQDEHFWPLG